MTEHVGVAMTFEAKPVRNFNAAEDQSPARDEPMDIKTLADPIIRIHGEQRLNFADP